MPTVSWPAGESGADPWDDGCWPSLDPDGRFAPLWRAWDAYRAGGGEDGLVRAASALGLTGPLAEDRNRPDGAHEPPDLATLARIAADNWPAVGMDGPDLVLGPASLFADPELLLVAVAGCAFAITADWPYPSFHVWSRQKPEPPLAMRAWLLGVALAPWALWGCEPRSDGLHLVDATGLGALYRPDGPVRVLGRLPVGAAMAARVLPTPSGWVAHTVVPLPDLPPRTEIERWVRHETWLARTHQPGITTEALLRKRPILVRRAIAWCGGVL